MVVALKETKKEREGDNPIRAVTDPFGPSYRDFLLIGVENSESTYLYGGVGMTVEADSKFL